MLVLKKNVHKPGHFQYTIHFAGKSFSCPRTQKGFTSYYMHFSSFLNIWSTFFLVSAILHHIFAKTLTVTKSYFKISTFQPNSPLNIKCIFINGLLINKNMSVHICIIIVDI